MSEIEQNDSVETPPPLARSEDLSALIVESMRRQPGEIVRCIRVSETHYRCNWWQREQPGESGRIARSAFLRVSNTADGLMIEDLTPRPRPTKTVA
jgi:hypothetical protein